MEHRTFLISVDTVVQRCRGWVTRLMRNHKLTITTTSVCLISMEEWVLIQLSLFCVHLPLFLLSFPPPPLHRREISSAISRGSASTKSLGNRQSGFRISSTVRLCSSGRISPTIWLKNFKCMYKMHERVVVGSGCIKNSLNFPLQSQ